MRWRRPRISTMVSSERRRVGKGFLLHPAPSIAVGPSHELRMVAFSAPPAVDDGYMLLAMSRLPSCVHNLACQASRAATSSANIQRSPAPGITPNLKISNKIVQIDTTSTHQNFRPITKRLKCFGIRWFENGTELASLSRRGRWKFGRHGTAQDEIMCTMKPEERELHSHERDNVSNFVDWQNFSRRNSTLSDHEARPRIV